MDGKDEHDVCIVGSGPAGAILASKLASFKIRTLVLESGYNPYNTTPVPGLGELDAYSSSGDLDYPVASTRFRGLGGTSNIWGGMCPRLLPRDFEVNRYTPSDATWPITYNDLEAYYQSAEQEMHVSGGETNIYSPPRSKEFPFEPESKGDISDLEKILGEVGLVVEYTPLAWSLKNNGPLSIMESHIPKLRTETYVTLVTGATITKVITERGGEVTGLEIRSLDQKVRQIRSRSYVLTCGGIETPRLLQLSRSPAFPQGIGVNSDQVGRYFMEHPDVIVIRGRVKNGESSIWKRANKRAISHQFDAEFKSRGLGSVVLLFDYWGVHLRDFDSKSPFASMGNMIDAYRRPTLVFRAVIEMEPSAHNRVTLNKNNKDYFGNPGAELSLNFTQKDRKTIVEARKLLKRLASYMELEDVEYLDQIVDWGHHHIGTCRMGADPMTSVVDKNLKVHGTKNLYISGSAVFVTGGSSMPTLTISALSLRLADHLLKESTTSSRKKSEVKLIPG